MNPLDYVRKTPYELYIDGKYVPAEKGKVVDVINPANNEPFAQVYRGTVEDAEKAVQAARKAFDEGPWGRTAARDRAKILAKAAQIMERRGEEFAVLESLECGYHYGSARYYCVPMAVDSFNLFAGKARDIEGKVVPSDYGTLNYVTWNPVGVVAEERALSHGLPENKRYTGRRQYLHYQAPILGSAGSAAAGWRI